MIHWFFVFGIYVESYFLSYSYICGKKDLSYQLNKFHDCGKSESVIGKDDCLSGNEERFFSCGTLIRNHIYTIYELVFCIFYSQDKTETYLQSCSV